MKEALNGVLADKLKNVKLDFKTYGDLPIGEDVILIKLPSEQDQVNKTLYKQWEKLIYVQRHLSTLDHYIQTNKGETFDQWLANNNLKTSDHVYKKLKGHNNDTGGISAYFFNLQIMYDEDEALYDRMEASGQVPVDFKKAVDTLRDQRAEKRKTRGEERKIILKDMKKDGKGYLYFEMEEPPTEEDLQKEKVAKEEQKAKETVKEEVVKIKKATGNIGIYIAGAILLVATVIVINNSSSEEQT